VLALLLVLAAAPAEPLTIVRKHAVGQKYAVEYSSSDAQAKTTKSFKGTAVVKSVTPERTTFDVTVDSIEWTGGPTKKSATGVKLRVEVQPGAVNAEVVEPGTLGEDAEFELTAFEQLMGQLCSAPKGPYYPKQPVVDGSNAWELQAKDEKLVRLKSSPAPNADPFVCEVTLSLDDGFAGERVGHLKAAGTKGGPKIDQKQTFKAKRL
jgi:hypothetical protein